MIYPFYCDACGKATEVVRSHTESSDPEFCDDCGERMRRVYTIPQVSCRVSLHSRVFGIDMTNKHAVGDMKRRYRDKTGGDMVEIGNEKPKLSPKRKKYTLTREDVQSCLR